MINGYRTIYLELLKEWHNLEKPEVIALLIYWLLHESSYGERKGESHNAGELINAALTLDTRREIDIACYKLWGIPKKEQDSALLRTVAVNEFDFANQLKKWNFALEINKENPFVTLEAMRKIFLNAYEASPRIKQLLDEMNQDQVYFYGYPIKR